MMKQVGVHAVVSLITYLVTIAFSFKAVKGLRVDQLFEKGHTFEIQIFLLFISIALGFLVGQFILALVDQSLALKMFF
ncbi:DUF1146 domain-containing protein [Lactobacillus paragasseri]|uniref:DUF1146 domain-containing protein n=1 Tax=Lactobacillus paragasseri TaxID=2107999 RepID=UPI00254A5327|nr:DUF1146 domain-containing protein [Lactobacillus paragasseri]MDK7136309.1 DUF1146 domain-containing protein [Lactobacillus paragasseri]